MVATPNLDALSTHLVAIATRAALDAGASVVDHAGRVAADQKLGFFDPVTECDRRAERIIAEHIFRDHPDSTIIGEEGGRQGDGAVQWFVDPIDGTVNFVAGIPFFSISIAAAPGGRMLAGVVYDPVRREVMAASTAGATLNGEPIRCTGGATDAESTVLTDFPKSATRHDRRSGQSSGRISWRADADGTHALGARRGGERGGGRQLWTSGRCSSASPR